MYKNKPLIIGHRPWYRHPIFPWGWYSMTQDNISTETGVIEADGYYADSDGGGGAFYWDPTSTDTDNGGTSIKPSD